MTNEVERVVRCIFYGDCPFNTMDCEEDTPHYRCKNRIVDKMVRIRYWYQETMESGRWMLTGLMPSDSALRIHESRLYEQSEIVTDSEYT